MVVIHWKYLVFLLISIFLFSCEYDSETICSAYAYLDHNFAKLREGLL